MIQPVNALTCKATFKGEFGNVKNPSALNSKKAIALYNAGGISTAIGGTMTIVGRSYANSWKSAFLIGLASAAVALTFLIPRFLYKAGIDTSKTVNDTDLFNKEKDIHKKLLSDNKKNLRAKVENYSKTLVKKCA